MQNSWWLNEIARAAEVTRLLFVFVNVPSSGGAFPSEVLPQPFRFLHDFMSGTATINLSRHTVYGVGPEPWHGWLVLACYAVAGVVLALVGRPYFITRMRRQRQTGRMSMMSCRRGRDRRRQLNPDVADPAGRLSQPYFREAAQGGPAADLFVVGFRRRGCESVSTIEPAAPVHRRGVLDDLVQ
jgi:hypothetical protein